MARYFSERRRSQTAAWRDDGAYLASGQPKTITVLESAPDTINTGLLDADGNRILKWVKNDIGFFSART